MNKGVQVEQGFRDLSKLGKTEGLRTLRAVEGAHGTSEWQAVGEE